MRTELSPQDTYLHDLFKMDDSRLNQIEVELKKDDKWGINIGPHEASLLKFFIKQFNVKSILEIGTLYGYSTYAMAKYLPEGGHITSIEKNLSNYTKAQELLDGVSNIELVNTDADVFLSEASSKYDLIFIDANKSAYLNYLNKSLNLLTDKGMVIGDNTFLFGHVFNHGLKNMSDKNIENMKKFNQLLIGDDKYDVTMIPTTEGMTLIKKV